MLIGFCEERGEGISVINGWCRLVVLLIFIYVKVVVGRGVSGLGDSDRGVSVYVSELCRVVVGGCYVN